MNNKKNIQFHQVLDSFNTYTTKQFHKWVRYFIHDINYHKTPTLVTNFESLFQKANEMHCYSENKRTGRWLILFMGWMDRIKSRYFNLDNCNLVHHRASAVSNCIVTPSSYAIAFLWWFSTRGKNDDNGNWNKRNDSGNDDNGSYDCNKGIDNERWKNSSASGSRKYNGDKKDRHSCSQQNADKECPS